MKSYLRFLGINKLYTAIIAVGLSVALALVIPLVSRGAEEGIGRALRRIDLQQNI